MTKLVLKALVKVLKQPLIWLTPLWSKHFIEDEFIYLVPQKLIRKPLWVAFTTFCEPLDCDLSKVVQACGTKPLLTVNE